MATTITANGINFPDGSAGSPSIGGTDTNTGLFTGSDIVGFATGGSERLRIDASGNVNIANDSGKLQLGTSADLQIYHSGSDSFIAETGTGQLKISGSAGVHIMKHDHVEVMASFYHDAGVELYHNNSKKFETTSYGVLMNGHTNYQDNQQIRFGASEDLKIYHDGSDSFIDDSGTGNLFIRSNHIQINKYTGENMIKAVADGAVELYHDNSKKVQTESAGITVFGSTQVDGTCHPYSDNNSDLGLSGNRWQDLYLSGNIYLGGTGSANALEDYEEGTFTPSVGGDSGGGSYTYSKQAGKYTKIGNTVFFQLYVTVNVVNANGSGNAMVNGLPFTSTGSSDYVAACVGYYHNFNGIVPSQALVDISATRLYLYKNNTSSNISHAVPTDYQNNTSLIISGHYYAA